MSQSLCPRHFVTVEHIVQSIRSGEAMHHVADMKVSPDEATTCAGGYRRLHSSTSAECPKNAPHVDEKRENAYATVIVAALIVRSEKQ